MDQYLLFSAKKNHFILVSMFLVQNAHWGHFPDGTGILEVLVFEEKGKTGTNNKLNPHMTLSPRIEPRPPWREASALITAPSQLPRGSYLALVRANHRIVGFMCFI